MDQYYRRQRISELIEKIKTQHKSGNFVIPRRGKNQTFIRKLGWLPSHVLDYIALELKITDYISGPKAHHKQGSTGVFGYLENKLKDIKFI